MLGGDGEVGGDRIWDKFEACSGGGEEVFAEVVLVQSRRYLCRDSGGF